MHLIAQQMMTENQCHVVDDNDDDGDDDEDDDNDDVNKDDDCQSKII